MMSFIKHSKYFFFVRFPLIILVLVLTFKYIFPQTEFVATNLIEHKIGSVGSSDDNKFYSSVMTFMGAMAAMLYLLYMILYDEMKLCNNHYSMLSINRRKVVSSFLMILFGMFCFTVVHIMPTDQSTFIETLAYTGLLLMILAFWYIVIAALNLAYINLDAAKTLKKEMKSSIKIKVSK